MAETIGKLINDRLKKLDFLRQSGVNPYANDFKPTHNSRILKEKFQNFQEEDFKKLENIEFSICGRIMAINLMGKAIFMRIQDDEGIIQIYIREDRIGKENFEHVKKYDIGDIIGCKGNIFKTKTGELTLLVKYIKILTKSLRPLPEKFHGLKDIELRYRKRYLDLIMNRETREIFVIRSKIIGFIRSFLNEEGFIEVETPMMHSIPGGANAKPFKTYHNALGIPLYLRIAPELFLKRLLVGGFTKVYEINRNFRNEGISRVHNPEFTMLEFYQCYATYKDLIELTEKLLSKLVFSLFGTYTINYNEHQIDFTPPFKCYTMKDAIIEFTGFNESDIENKNFLYNLLKEKNPDVDISQPYGELLSQFFEEFVESKLIQPTFVTQYPVEVSPLSRRNENFPEYTDRFELFICGMEIANGFSELNDPIDQKERFLNQIKSKQYEMEEIRVIDEDFIEALEYGMPPAAGEGIGIDRLVMILTNQQSIRDVILFPLLKPET